MLELKISNIINSNKKGIESSLFVNSIEEGDEEHIQTYFTGLSPKDTTYISDIITALVDLSKKIDHYEQSVMDAQVKSHLTNTRTLVNQHYDTLLGVLQNG